MGDYTAEELFAMTEEQIADFLVDVPAETIEGFMMTLQAHVDDLNVKRGAFASAYNAKMSVAAAQRKVALMSDDEKAALVQVIQAEGLAGQHPVGDQ